jgi:DNA-binding GntR family transcriptional regulator
VKNKANFSLPKSLLEKVIEFLSNGIIEGRFAPGERLVENKLQQEFGISRAPIRESFRVLQKSGLVISSPRKGTFVRKISSRDIWENFPIRASLESLAARLAVPNLTSKDIKQMELFLSKMQGAAKKNDFKSYIKYHSEYHVIFIQASKNSTLIEIIENLRQQAMWHRFSYLYFQESYKYSIRVHQEILDAFIKKDSDQVEALVKDHIMIGLSRFLAFLSLKDEQIVGT